MKYCLNILMAYRYFEFKILIPLLTPSVQIKVLPLGKKVERKNDVVHDMCNTIHSGIAVNKISTYSLKLKVHCKIPAYFKLRYHCLTPWEFYISFSSFFIIENCCYHPTCKCFKVLF